MANAIYPKFKEAVMQNLANTNLSSGVVKAALVDTGTYTYNAAHDFLDDVTGRVGTDQTLASKTFTNGVFDAANSVFPSVTGASVEAIILYVDTGVGSTSRLIAYIDTGISGFPLTPDGNNININWDAAGIFTL